MSSIYTSYVCISIGFAGGLVFGFPLWFRSFGEFVGVTRAKISPNILAYRNSRSEISAHIIRICSHTAAFDAYYTYKYTPKTYTKPTQHERK